MGETSSTSTASMVLGVHMMRSPDCEVGFGGEVIFAYIAQSRDVVSDGHHKTITFCVDENR